MLNLELNQITESFLQQLCDDHVPETRTLDFKRDLPSSGESGSVEFMKDVCSFANHEGGDLVYGIDERKDEGGADKIVPIKGEADAAKRRLVQIFDGIEPRVHGIDVHHVEVTDGYVLIVRVPQSFDGPHCYSKSGKSGRSFYVRNNTVNTEMSYSQLRAAFGQTASLAELAKKSMNARAALFMKFSPPIPMVEHECKLFIQLVPLASMLDGHRLDMRSIYNDAPSWLTMKNWRGSSKRINHEGVIYFESGEPVHSYNSILRYGALEGVHVISHSQNKNNLEISKRRIDGSFLSETLVSTVAKFLAMAKHHGMSGPALLKCVVGHLKNCQLQMRGVIAETTPPQAYLMAGPEWIENIGIADARKVVAPVLDFIWQSFGEVGCTFVDHAQGICTSEILD